MAAPTLSSNLGLAAGAGATRATASVTWAAGDIVVWGGCSEGSQTESFSTPTASGLTFSSVINISAGTPSHAALAIYTATAASSGSSAVTGTLSNGTSTWNAWVWVWHSSGGVGNNASTASPSSTKTVSLTPTAADSGIVWMMGDWNGGSITPSATPTSPNETTRQATGTSGYNYLTADITDQTSAGAVSYGVTTTSTGPFTIGVLEIKGTGGGGGTVPKSQSLGNGTTWSWKI